MTAIQFATFMIAPIGALLIAVSFFIFMKDDSKAARYYVETPEGRTYFMKRESLEAIKLSEESEKANPVEPEKALQEMLETQSQTSLRHGHLLADIPFTEIPSGGLSKVFFGPSAALGLPSGFVLPKGAKVKPQPDGSIAILIPAGVGAGTSEWKGWGPSAYWTTETALKRGTSPNVPVEIPTFMVRIENK